MHTFGKFTIFATAHGSALAETEGASTPALLRTFRPNYLISKIMDNKRLLLGDEALALGAINAGLSGVYAYPGTPSTEITEFIQGNPLATQRGIHSHWSSNEKTAMEEALGMSFCGKRAMVCMKHVGLNVAADGFVNSAMTGANGGLVEIGRAHV